MPAEYIVGFWNLGIDPANTLSPPFCSNCVLVLVWHRSADRCPSFPVFRYPTIHCQQLLVVSVSVFAKNNPPPALCFSNRLLVFVDGCAALDSAYRTPVSSHCSVMGRGNHASRKPDAGSATDAATAYKQALKLCGEGTYGKALTLFDRAITFRVDCSHYFAARANCKQALGQHVDAYHDYVSAISLNRRKCTYFSCRGLCLIKMGKLDAALSDFSKACELEPSAAVYHYQKASLLNHRLGRPGEAVLSYAECLAKVGPGDTAMGLRCLHARGACLFEEGRAVEAVADLSRAVEMPDASPASLHYLAKALKAVGREKRALAALGEAIDKWEEAPGGAGGGGGACRNSGRHEALFDRGVMRLQRGDDAAALSDFDQAVSLSGGARGEYFVQRARARARVAMRSNGREEAIAGVQDIEKAMELESSNPEFLFTAGVLCSRMGEYERALGHLQLLLEFFEGQAVASRAKTQELGGREERSEEKGEWSGSPISPSPPTREHKGGGSKDAVASPAACKFEAALCLFKLGRSAEALKLAESALTTCCSLDAQRFQLRGLILQDLRRYAEAAKDFTASIAVRGQRPEGYLLRGRSLAGLSNHKRAIRDFTTALTLLGSEKIDKDSLGGPRFREASSSATEIKDSDEGPGRGGDAAATTEQNEIEDSGNPNPRAPHERCPLSVPNACGGIDEAQPFVPEPGQLQEPHDEDGRLKLNRHHDSSPRRHSQGADGGDGMAEGGSVVGACRYARALSLQQLGRHADAASDFDAAIAEGPVSWQRLWHRAICLAELGEAFRPCAARDLEACVSMAKNDEPPPEMRNFLFQVGLAYYRLGQSSTALGCFDRARKEELRQLSQHDSSLEDPSLHYHRGLCLMKANELDQAEDAFSLAIERRKSGGQRRASGTANGTDTRMQAAHHRERGKARQLLRDFDAARSDFTICLALSRQQTPATAADDSPRDTAGCGPESPRDARTLFQRGWANKALGRLDQAAADFEAARRLEPLHPHFSVDYRNIFDTELVVVDDIEPLTQAPALFHSW